MSELRAAPATELDATSEPSDTRTGETASTTSASALGPLVLLGITAGIFTLIARSVATRRAEVPDQAAREWIQEHRTTALDVAVKPVTLLSVPVLVVAATGVLVVWLHRSGRREAAAAVALAPVVAATAGQSFSTFLAQRNPPDVTDAPAGEVKEPSFPSGHTTGVTAEALVIAYVLSREGLGSASTLAALLAWPLLVGTSRVYRDRHWISDIVGGWTAGTGVAALSALAYARLAARGANARTDG